MTRHIHRYEVPIDGQEHDFLLTSKPLHVESRNPWDSSMEFWTEFDDDPEVPKLRRWFVVLGTGHPIPEGARHVGTGARTDEGLVWHLYATRT